MKSCQHLLGVIPDFKLTTSANEEKKFGKHLKSRKLHQALKVILKSFVDFQKGGHGKPISLSFGKYNKRLKLKTPCFFIIRDMQGGDKMACLSLSYSNKIYSLCRKCDI